MVRPARMRLCAATRATARAVGVACLFFCIAPDPGCAAGVGETAGADAYAPMPLRVVDVDATLARLAPSGEQAPVALRHDAKAVESAVAQLTVAFQRTREAFLDGLEKAFGARVVGTREINSAAFRNFRSDFQTANPLFPVNLVLAQSWAKGYDGEPTLARMASALRRVYESRLIGEVRPASTVFLVPISADERVRNWGEVSRLARTVERSEIISIEAAGLELRRMLDALDRVAGGFLSGLLQPNVAEDGHLTALLFDERFGDRAVRAILSAGEPIARQGSVLDRRAILILNHLQRSGLVPLSRAPVSGESPSGAPAAVVVPDARRNELETPAPSSFRGLPGVLVVTVALALLGAGGLVVLRRRRRSRSREQLAVRPDEQAGPTLKEALLPHLARELKDKLVHVLFAQRHELLHNEEEASRRVAEMEERLSRLQPAIAERIRSYEQRIAALEKQLEEKDQETRDLIRAKLVLARRELDEEITRSRVRWN